MAPALLAMDVADITNLSREAWGARVLAGFCSAALRFGATGGSLCVNYNQLPEALWTRLASHWGITFSPFEVTLMREIARFDAKRPTLRFQPDVPQKQGEATDALRELAASLLTPLYLELERLARISIPAL